MAKRRLRLILPPVQCDSGCGKCCGIAPATYGEVITIKRYIEAHSIEPIDQGLTMCPFFQGGTCAIYPVRPRICQAYGHSVDLPCARGYSANVDEDALRAWIQAPGLPTTTLHTFLREGGPK